MRRRRKPDLLAVLVFIVGLGMIVTSLAQGMLNTPLAKNQPLVSQAHPAKAFTDWH
jgi:hypothetical protein